MSWCAISRPRNMIITRTLSPRSRNSRACSTRISIMCGSVFGRIRTVFSFVLCCLRPASCAFLFCSYLYLPKSMILQTGGRTFGATSTRSSPFSCAICIACSVGTTPTCFPSASIRRTSRIRIRSLIRGPVAGAGIVRSSGRMVKDLPSADVGPRPGPLGPLVARADAAASEPFSRSTGCHTRGEGGTPAPGWRAPSGELDASRSLCDAVAGRREEGVERHRAQVLPRLLPNGDRRRLGLARSDDEHVRDALDRRETDLRTDLVAARVDLDPQPRGPEPLEDRLRVLVLLARDGQHARLHRRQPQRELPGVVLDEHRDLALHRAQDRAVQHHRRVLVAVLARV